VLPWRRYLRLERVDVNAQPLLARGSVAGREYAGFIPQPGSWQAPIWPSMAWMPVHYLESALRPLRASVHGMQWHAKLFLSERHGTRRQTLSGAGPLPSGVTLLLHKAEVSACAAGIQEDLKMASWVRAFSIWHGQLLAASPELFVAVRIELILRDGGHM